MEYMKVTVSKSDESEGKKKDVAVFINGEKNGTVGEVLTLDEGWIEVSVDLPNAETKEVDLENTTRTHPMVVEIEA